MTDTSLFEELLNRNIDFIDDEGNVTLSLYSSHKNFIINSHHTNWIDIPITHIKNNKKYTKLANIKEEYYQGDIKDGELKNMMTVLFKMEVKEGCFSTIIRKYILMIVDNPEYNDDNTNINRYILIIYGIDRIGTLGRELRVIDILKSNI